MLFKVLTAERTGGFTHFNWPEVGGSVPRIDGRLVSCTRGYHALTEQQVLPWLVWAITNKTYDVVFKSIISLGGYLPPPAFNASTIFPESPPTENIGWLDILCGDTKTVIRQATVLAEAPLRGYDRAIEFYQQFSDKLTAVTAGLYDRFPFKIRTGSDFKWKDDNDYTNALQRIDVYIRTERDRRAKLLKYMLAGILRRPMQELYRNIKPVKKFDITEVSIVRGPDGRPELGVGGYKHY